MNSRCFISRCLRQLQATSFYRSTVPCHARMVSSISVLRGESALCIPKIQVHNLETRRYKSKKKANKGQQKVDSDDEDENDEDDEMSTGDALPGEQEKILKMSQVRLDKLVKLAFNSGKTLDEAFLEGRLRKNDEKVVKKTLPIIQGDIVDIEIGPDNKNPDFLRVHRIEVLEVKDGTVHSAVRILLCKNLTIKAYDN